MVVGEVVYASRECARACVRVECECAPSSVSVSPRVKCACVSECDEPRRVVATGTIPRCGCEKEGGPATPPVGESMQGAWHDDQGGRHDALCALCGGGGGW